MAGIAHRDFPLAAEIAPAIEPEEPAGSLRPRDPHRIAQLGGCHDAAGLHPRQDGRHLFRMIYCWR